MRRLERRLRLVTGLVIACFVVPHLLNHSLGVVSIDAMDRARGVLAQGWRSPLGTILLYGALLVHFSLALVSLYRRTTLRMPVWEAAQILLGLAVPPLLIAHIVGTRFTWLLLGHTVNYERVIGLLWSDAWSPARQTLLLLVVWLHLAFGLHYWLRLQRWYPAAQPAAFAAALLIPAMSLAGFAAAGNELRPVIDSVGMQAYLPELASMTDEQRARLAAWRDGLVLAFWALVAATLLARWLRVRLGGTYELRHSSGRVISAPIGRSILEALRDEGVPHASVCGGRARCTTCRVRVTDGLAALVAPLLPPGADPGVARAPGAPQGRERPIVAMFVDLRESTRLCESRLPYDAVFIINQFFAEMYAALRDTGGYYAQFRGDGLLALYGLEGELAPACRAALRGAAAMQRRVEALSGSLAAELAEPLRIGIGMHAGVAIVGTMGPPEAPIHSAIGDTVNIAARFEGMTKAYGCVLVVSADTLAIAGVEAKEAPLHRVRVRGRNERVSVYAIADPRTLQP
jgi:adenylate cyclase